MGFGWGTEGIFFPLVGILSLLCKSQRSAAQGDATLARPETDSAGVGRREEAKEQVDPVR